MPLLRAGRPLKRWRYVGVFCEELFACAALIQVGPARQSFWAVCSRADGRLRERTSLLPRGGTVVLEPGRLRVRDRGVMLDLSLEEGAALEARCTHGRGQVWTRKQVGVAARGVITLDGEPPRAIEALAAIDDTAGYHARHTEWWWSAGVGESPDGVPLAWNLVAGVNDPLTGSERAVWVDGAPHEVPPIVFTPDLSRISCAEDSSELRFVAEAERRRHENLLIISSDYRAPFGTFSGTLPGNIPLAHGLGVAEHHRARW